MENQAVVLGNQDGGMASGTAPALYVLVKQPQSTGKADQGALASNQDGCGLASSAAAPIKSKVKNTLPADFTSGSITVTLDNNNMWNEFYYRSTEMILTKQGRRMFPYCRYWITGLDSKLKYILVMDISPVDNLRYKWNGQGWEPSGKAEPHVLGRVFIHPESPSTGRYWMHQPVSFYKLKLTNNTLDQEGHIILHSMHRYLPRLHLVPADKATEVIQLNGPDVHTFTFPQTEFFAVTAYQNIQITQLKIDYNPFAKGFRDDGLSSRLQRDVKQNGSSDQEGGSVNSSPSNHRHLTEGDLSDPGQRDKEPSFSGMCNTDLDRDCVSPYHDFLGFMETDMHMCDSPVLKQESPESPVASPFQNSSHVASSLNSNGSINVVVKEEPADDYDYRPSMSMEGIDVKREEAENMAEEYSHRHDSILEKQLKEHNEVGKKEIEIESYKRPPTSQLGVAKAKMLKLDSGKMPVVYLEPCSITRDTVKFSALSQAMSPCKSTKSPLSHSSESLPTCFENNSISSPFMALETEDTQTGKQMSENNVPHRSTVRDVLWENAETDNSLTIIKKVSSCSLKATAYSGPSLAKDTLGGGKTNALKYHVSRNLIVGNPKVGLSGPRKRGRPRKIKSSEVGRPPKYAGKSVTTSTYASLGPGSIHLDVKPDLEDVDGMLFVSFASKEALDIHTVDRSEEKEKLQNSQIPSLAICESEELQKIQTSLSTFIDPESQRIQQLEKELLEELKSYKYKQVIHPSLREVGLKLNFVDPTMSIDLKYLGVQLPLSYSDDYILWKNLRTNSSSDTGLPFVSRTGKTNDFTKIKGWREKLHSSSKNEGSILEGSLKNRSAFCSDKLDEYLENEGKLMKTSMEFSPSTSSCPVVYQLPTKSTSYVRTLDSVLKKQSTITTSSSYTFKPLSLPSVSRKKREKIKNKKQAIIRGKEKSHQKPIIALPVVTKQKCNLPVLEEKVTKSQPSGQAAETDAVMAPGIEENVQGKHITVHHTQQQQQSSRLPSLSKTQLKLMDLEDCALWDGKPRTYITEERADLSLTTLLTAQASLKNKPIYKIIKRRAPPCNNDFCRLGCICSSLALEKRRPTHCCKPDCMFGCACLKRKVVLVKGRSKHKNILEKPLHGRHTLYCAKEVKQQEEVIEKEEEKEKVKLKDKKKKKKMEYTICGTEPEKPVKNFPLWVKDGEMDPEPIYIPTPSAVEPTEAMPPIPEVLSSDNKPASGEIKPPTSGVKPVRVYTPRPNPVIREEDKDPVYLYFESMMTCARVRIYERKKQEKRQQQRCPWNSEKHIEKSFPLEHDLESQPFKMEDDKEPGDKSWWFSCSAGDPSTSYVHHTTPGGTTKLIEIVSDCNWEEDRNEILNILSQHVKSKMPKSIKVGNFVIELESETKTWDEKNTPIYSSRVKISMLSCQNKGEKANLCILEDSNNGLSPCKRTEKITFLTAGMLREQRKKGLPFYAGLSPAGKLMAYTFKSDLNPSSLIQVNGKNYPQAKLLLGQMGALHPANRLAAYITGRLRPTMLDLSTVSTVISKVASNVGLAASEPQSTKVPTTETSKAPLSSNTTSASTATSPNAHASAQRQIAARPLLHSVASQLVISAVGALHQKIPGTRTSQPLTGPQKFNIKSTPLSAGTTTVASASTVASLAVTASNSSPCNKAVYSSGAAIANAVGKPENRTVSTTATRAPVKIAKSPGIATSIANITFVKSGVGTSPVSVPVCTTSLSTVLTTTASMATVTAPMSSISCVAPGPSGVPKSPFSNQKPGTTSPPGLSPGAEKRMGPQLLLIPVHQGSPTLRPQQNMQVAQGKRMILQPLRNPGGVNLYRHPNGQIIQLVPLHQLQPAGPQPNLSPVIFRNPGSVVGIRLPSPSKPPEVSVGQSSVVPSVTPTTMATSVLSATPTLSGPATTKATSVLPGTSTTAAVSVLSGIPTIQAPLVLSVPPILSTPSAPEAPSVLSVSPTAGVPLGLSVAPSVTPMPPVAEASSVLPVPSIAEALSALPMPPFTTATSVLPRTPTTEALSMLSVSPSVSFTSSVTEAPSILHETSSTMPMSPTTTATSLLPRISTNEAPLMLSAPPSVVSTSSAIEVPATGASLRLSMSPTSAMLPAAEAPSASTVAPPINQTLQVIGSVPALPISSAQSVPDIPAVPVPVPQTGSLTLRISPSGVTQTTPVSKIISNTSGQQNNADNLLSLQSGSFALLQFPEQKNVPSSILKQVVSLEVKNTSRKDEFSAVKPEVKMAYLQEVEAMESEIIMSISKPEENKLPENHLEPSYEEITCGENAVTSEITKEDAEILEELSNDNPVLEPEITSSDHSFISGKIKCGEDEVMEDAPNEVSYSSVPVPENCSQTAVLTHNTLKEQKVTQLQNLNDDQTYSEQTQSPATDSGIEHKQLKIDEEMIIEQFQKPWNKHKVHTSCTEKKMKSFPSTWENEDQKLLGQNWKERVHTVTTEMDREEGNKYMNSALELSSKRNTSFHRDNLTLKDDLVPVSKISRQSDALENKNTMGADALVEKFAKYEEQNILKTSYHRKDSLPIIDITMDDTEKDEKTDDSADEIVDEASGYQSEDIVNIETLNESESSEAEDNVDIETVEELTEKINIARLKATAAHVLLSKQLHLVHDHSSKKIAKTPKQSEISNRKSKNEEEAFSNYRETHTANERRRRKEMRGLFEKLKATLGLQSLPKVSKCFILKQAFEEIQGLTDQADKLSGQKNLLTRKQDTLIRKVSALSGKTQEVVLKKLEYIYAKQKAVEAQKKKQEEQTEPMKKANTVESAIPTVEDNPSPLFKEMKPTTLSNKRTKPLILSRKGSRDLGDTFSPMTLTNASLVMTTNGQVLAFKNPLVQREVTALPSTLLQAELKSEADSSKGTTQPGIASVMIQLTGSAVPVEVKGILPNSTVPITLSAVPSSSSSPVVETAPELISENEDSFMMPRIVNVTSLATKDDTNLNLDINTNSYVTLDTDSQTSEPSLQVLSQDTTNLQSEEKAEPSSAKKSDATGTVHDFLHEKESFPQILNVSSLTGSPESFATKLCIEELARNQARLKQRDKGGDGQKSKVSAFQKLQVNEPKDSGIEMELQKVASAIHEPALDASDLMDIEENDDTDETLTSLLNEIAFLNQQLNDDASDISELPNSLSSGFSLGDLESRKESTTAEGSPFQFGVMGGSFKDLSVVQDSSDSIAPLLLHLDDDDLPDDNKNSGELSSESDALKIMLGSDPNPDCSTVKDPNPDCSAVKSGGSGKNMQSLAKARSVSPPILQMKTNLEAGKTDIAWRPMPKLAPLGLKAANLPLEAEGQNTKVMPSLAPVAAKEIKTAQPVTSPSQESKVLITLAPVTAESK